MSSSSSSSSSVQGYIRVYLLDGSWLTVPIDSHLLTINLLYIIAKKRKIEEKELHHYNLYLLTNNTERLVKPNEKPLILQESLRQQGLINNSKLIFKQSAENQQQLSGLDNNPANPCNLCDSVYNVIDMNGSLCVGVHLGYLSKRGKTNTAWKLRWFILVAEKLYYFKQHTHNLNQAIAAIPINEATVQQMPTHPNQQIADDTNSNHNSSNSNNSSSSNSSNLNNIVSQSSSRYIFAINTVSRTFYLRALDYEDMHAWLVLLRSSMINERCNDCIDSIQEIIDNNTQQQAGEEYERYSKLLEKNLNYLLSDLCALRCFLSFCVENHCEENLLLWLDCEEYRSNNERNEPQNYSRAMQLYENYLTIGAIHEVNIQNNQRAEIFNNIQLDSNKTAFMNLQQQTFALMQSSIYTQFLHSKQFQQALIAMNPTNETNPKLFHDNLLVKLVKQRIISSTHTGKENSNNHPRSSNKAQHYITRPSDAVASSADLSLTEVDSATPRQRS
jgi:hypothetical protein